MSKTNQCSIEQIHEVDIETLKKLDCFFTENNIIYTASRGTALGAARHKGFIPWDDDVDLDMHVDDMRKLAKLWKKKGLPGFFLQNKWTDPNVPWPHWRIRKKGTIPVWMKKD